jgi:PAS domain S-box-containing protein
MRQVEHPRTAKAEHRTSGIVDEELARANARIRDLEAALDAAHRKLGGEGDEPAAPTRDALARSERRFRALIDDLHLGVVVQGPHSEILLHNERALELLGLSEDEMLGRSSFHPSWQVIREDGMPFVPEERPVATVLATRKAVCGVVMGIHRPRTSDLVWLLVTAKPEFNAAGEIVQVVCTLDDISERKQLETSLRQTQKLESLGLLAGGIAHDFNNLLSVITSCTELAHYQVASDSEVARELDEVLVAAERATSLTRQLLSFARRQVVSPRHLDLNELLAGQFEKLLSRLLGEHHRLVIERDEQPALVRLDQGQLEQVFVNLVVNARDAMPKGGQITITIDQLVVGQAPAPLSERPVVRVVVRDEGTGIPPEIKERLFEPFFTTKPVGRGTGLGLATVHGIVQQSSGLIEVRSEFGQGSEFHVLLPAEHGAVEASGEASELGRQVGRGQLVLVVDDEPVLRSVTSRMLVTLGYRTLEAGDGFDALDVLEPRAGDIDLVFSDVVMPRMGGVELAHRIRKHWPAMRIVLTSGYAQVAVDDDEAGIADAMLPKPFNAASLARVIREVLSLA